VYETKNQKIIEYRLQKFPNKLYEYDHLYYVIVTDGKVYSLNDYVNLKESDPNTPPVFIFIINQWVNSKSDQPVLYYHPFLRIATLITEIYLETYYYESPCTRLNILLLLIISKTLKKLL